MCFSGNSVLSSHRNYRYNRHTLAVAVPYCRNAQKKKKMQYCSSRWELGRRQQQQQKAHQGRTNNNQPAPERGQDAARQSRGVGWPALPPRVRVPTTGSVHHVPSSHERMSLLSPDFALRPILISACEQVGAAEMHLNRGTLLSISGQCFPRTYWPVKDACAMRRCVKHFSNTEKPTLAVKFR
jgi:hypothetical protein